LYSAAITTGLLCNLHPLILGLAAAADNNNNNNGNGGGRGPCAHCGLTMLLPRERCPVCFKVGRNLVKIVDERMVIRDKSVRVLASFEKKYWFLLGSLAITVIVPLAFLAFGVPPELSTVFSVIFGLVSFVLGAYGAVVVRRIYTEV
jgi:hypothetical protein